MILLADSGSTKTIWCFAGQGTVRSQAVTSGINPVLQDDEAILGVLTGELLTQAGPELPGSVDALYFYGAGVLPEQKERMCRLLRQAFFRGDELVVESDLLGAARALFQHGEGIACILGTGSNSGLYDGHGLVDHVSPLGFILGDEGSGAVMGKHLVSALYKRQLPARLADDFARETGLGMADVIRRVYREPMPNRFLASLAPFVSRHIGEPAVQQFVTDEFRTFFRRNVAAYGHRDLAVGVVGSIGWYFADYVRRAAEAEGFALQSVLSDPVAGLLAYHGG